VPVNGQALGSRFLQPVIPAKAGIHLTKELQQMPSSFTRKIDHFICTLSKVEMPSFTRKTEDIQYYFNHFTFQLLNQKTKLM
jgi:hypothetical protein